MHQPNAQDSAMNSSQQPGNGKNSFSSAPMAYPHKSAGAQHTKKGFLYAVKTFFRRIFLREKPPSMRIQSLISKKVVFRSTTSTFITPIGSYAGAHKAPDMQRMAAIDQFKKTHTVPQGSTVN